MVTLWNCTVFWGDERGGKKRIEREKREGKINDSVMINCGEEVLEGTQILLAERGPLQVTPLIEKAGHREQNSLPKGEFGVSEIVFLYGLSGACSGSLLLTCVLFGIC